MHSLPSLAAFSTDWIVFGLLVLIGAIDTWRSGSSRPVAIALALPLAVVLFNTMPQALIFGSIATKATPIMSAVLFTILTVISFFACYRIIGAFSADDGSIPRALITGIAATVLIMVFALQIPVFQSAWHASSSFAMIFGVTFRWWWIVGGFAMLAYIRS